MRVIITNRWGAEIIAARVANIDVEMERDKIRGALTVAGAVLNKRWKEVNRPRFLMTIELSSWSQGKVPWANVEGL